MNFIDCHFCIAYKLVNMSAPLSSQYSSGFLHVLAVVAHASVLYYLLTPLFNKIIVSYAKLEIILHATRVPLYKRFARSYE